MVGCGEGEPVHHAIVEGAEDVGDFEGVEGAELGFSFAGDGAIETVDKGAMARAGDEGSLRAGGAGGADVVARLVDCGSAVHHDAGSVGGDSKVCPVAVEGAGEIGEDLELVAYAGLGAGGRGFLGGGFADYAEGGELAGVEAGHEIDGEEFAGGVGVGGGAREDPAIDLGGVGVVAFVVGGDEVVFHVGELRGGKGAEGFELGGGWMLSEGCFAEGVGERLHVRDGAGGAEAEGRAALGDDAAEEAAGEGRGHEDGGVDAAGGFAEEGDVGGIATEGCDVLLHPAESGDLVEEAVVAGAVVGRLGGELGVGEEAHDAEAIVDGDEDYAMGGEDGAVVCGLRAAADAVASSMQPDHDGEMRAGLERWCPDVEVEAVFGGVEGLGDVVDTVGCGQRLNEVVGAVDVLRAGVRELGSVADA